MTDRLSTERDPFTFGLGDKVLTRLDVPGIVTTLAIDVCGPLYLVEQPTGSDWFRPLEIRHTESKAG